MRFFSTIFLIFSLIYIQILPAFSAEMMLGRITDQGGEIFTLPQMVQAALFAAIGMTMIIKKSYHNAVLKSTIAFLFSIAFLCLVAPTATALMSLPSFSEFRLLGIFAALISLISLYEFSRLYIMHDKPDNVIIKRLSYGIYTAITIATVMLSVMSYNMVTSFLDILWVGSLIAVAVGSNVKNIKNMIDTDIFMYCIVPIMAGLFLTFGVHGNDQIIPIAVRFVGFSGAWIAAIAMAYKLYMNHKNNKTGQSRHIEPDQNFTAKAPLPHMSMTLNIASHSVTINENLAHMIGLESAKRDYDIDHFKALIHQEYHNHFLSSLYENEAAIELPIMFHGSDTHYHLKQVGSENLNKITFNVIEVEAPKMTSAAADISEPETAPVIAQAHSLFDVFFNSVKETIFETPQNLEGHHVLILIDIRNLEMLFLEGTNQESKKVPEILISRLTKKIMHFQHLRIAQTSATEFGIFFYSPNASYDIQVAENMINNICELPIECSFGNFFPKFISASSHMPALDLRQSLKNDALLNKLFDNVQKDILSRSILKGEIIPDDIPMPNGTTMLGLSSELRYAPEKNQIEPYFSPYISLETGNISGFYTRPFWLHPDHGLIDNKLLSFLSDYIGYDGIIQRMHMIMAVECFSKMIQKKATAKSFLRIPIGPVALKGKFDLVSELSVLIKKFNIPASQIHVCLMDECMTNPNANSWLLPFLKDMKSIGLTIVLENYGGHTTRMSHLTDLPIDHIILNKSLINNLKMDERKQYAVQTLLELFQNLNIETDVNHLENLEQIQILKKYGVKNIMGSACGKEMSYGNISAYISQKSKSNHFA